MLIALLGCMEDIMTKRLHCSRSQNLKTGHLCLRFLNSAVRFAFLVLAMLLGLASFERLAVAYTDPGTGALIWQMAAAAFIGAAFYFRRFMTWLRGKKTQAGRTAAESNREQSSDANERES